MFRDNYIKIANDIFNLKEKTLVFIFETFEEHDPQLIEVGDRLVKRVLK
ncbi:hypothetical protein [Athalassotoga saccharophila]|nr:hypothetical protein [Athalassotoga saccharophila]BBJ27504.1 hypothetical protein ATHSA_0373 [Athalassotoga saccharophila]